MAAGLKDRTEVKRVGAQALDVIQPAQDLAQAGLRLRLEIVVMRRGASPEGIDVVKDAVLIDSSHNSSELYQAV